MAFIHIDLTDNANCAALWQIIAHFGGYAHQKQKTIEELAELEQALARDLQGEGDRANIAEEIADVVIMLGQMILIYGLHAEVPEIAQRKLQRTLERIDREQEGEVKT